MAVTISQIGYGALFGIGDDGGPEAFPAMAEVESITPPSDNVDIVEATHLSSPNRTKEFIKGLNDPGETSIEIHFLPGEADDDAIQILRTRTTPKNFRITFPAIAPAAAVKWTFAGFLVGYEPSISAGELMTATLRIKVTGSYTIS